MTEIQSPDISLLIYSNVVFHLEKMEHTLVQITYTFSHSFHGLEISFEHKSLIDT